jgi:hypothetical protein
MQKVLQETKVNLANSNTNRNLIIKIAQQFMLNVIVGREKEILCLIKACLVKGND